MDMADAMLLVEYINLPYLRIISLTLSIAVVYTLITKLNKKNILKTSILIAIPLLILAFFSGKEFNTVSLAIATMTDPKDKETWDNYYKNQYNLFHNTWVITEYIEYACLSITGLFLYLKSKKE